ncbi:MAG: methylcrotonoyl-CoA carboxylase [Candidatus Schekmanbacteria bacterium]|nr:methylcrotonoyl-CoA carboxylase [Candidatus Schekmanbacteria bacterium]
MEVLESHIDTSSAAYQENSAENRRLADELRERLRNAREDRSDKAYERHTEQGKIPVRQRIERLLDPGTPFLELCPLAAYGLYDGRVHGAGSVTGIGIVHGREFLVTGNDAMVKGGTIFPMTLQKSLREQKIVMENRLPSIILVDSGGAYLPLQDEIFALGGRIFYHQAIVSKMGLPQICVVMGHCTAGGAYIPAMSTYTIIVKKTGGIFLGGPPLVRAATGEIVSAEELGGADVHCAISGVADYYAEDDAHALQIARDLAENVSVHEKTRIPMREPRPPLYDPQELYGIIPRSISQPYDVREVIARLVDGSEFSEFKARWGTTLVTGFAYIHGYQVGILANNGVLFSESALKGTHFIQICNQRKIPMLFLQNIMGFIIGKEYERRGITKDGHKMVAAVACSTVPKFTVIIGGSFGAGNYAMCGHSYNPRFLWTWPNARISVMGGEQAADVLVSVKNDQLAREGQAPMPKQFADQMRLPVVALYEKEGSPYNYTAQVRDDGILDPVKTRDVLGLAISVSLNAPIPDPGYGVFRM